MERIRDDKFKFLISQIIDPLSKKISLKVDGVYLKAGEDDIALLSMQKQPAIVLDIEHARWLLAMMVNAWHDQHPCEIFLDQKTIDVMNEKIKKAFMDLVGEFRRKRREEVLKCRQN